MARVRTPRLGVICAGIALESYDWVLYALLVAYFAPVFFAGDLRRSLLFGFGVFAAGFVARPLGGVLLGRLADRRGRRIAMLVCVAGAGTAAYGMALTPGTAVIGPAAPVLVLVWRLLLGLSQGGELPVAQTYLYECAPPARTGLFTSMFYVFAAAGKLAASVLAAVLVSVLGRQAMLDGWWRLPFLLGGIAATAFFLLRLRLPDTRATTAPEPRPPRDRRALLGPMAVVAGLTVGVTSAYYLWTAAPTAYALTVLGLDDDGVLWAGVGATVVFALALPAFGLLGDRIGVRRTLFGGTLAMAAATVPLHLLLEHATPVTYWAVILVATVLLACLCATLPASMSALFPARHRALGQALPYGVTVAVFGGTTPFFEQLTATSDLVLPVYVVVLLLVSAWTNLASARRDRQARGSVAENLPIVWSR
ncbi:Alpha-ketoglutarate permease [Nocardia otitidiscaviarum]|uniref:Alpha-ketoglutarate permease n=2 Tax=Nocardia otitidiscaviarum TaxID=1823 RepID=A0A379JLN1_9NOCA|nr:MFS transporter [Nocardia otitidiscaviarum]SUD48903.1 Alpha-ketoglutarate permease [Nocardia otitidiscaviarum]